MDTLNFWTAERLFTVFILDFTLHWRTFCHISAVVSEILRHSRQKPYRWTGKLYSTHLLPGAPVYGRGELDLNKSTGRVRECSGCCAGLALRVQGTGFERMTTFSFFFLLVSIIWIIIPLYLCFKKGSENAGDNIKVLGIVIHRHYAYGGVRWLSSQAQQHLKTPGDPSSVNLRLIFGIRRK